MRTGSCGSVVLRHLIDAIFITDSYYRLALIALIGRLRRVGIALGVPSRPSPANVITNFTCSNALMARRVRHGQRP